MMEYILSSMKVHLASVYEKILSSMKVNLSSSKVNLSSVEVGLSSIGVGVSGSEVNLSSMGVGVSGSEVNLSSVEVNLSSGEVNLSSSKVNLSSMKVNLSSVEVGSSGMKVTFSRGLILKSIVCCVCVMFSSDVSWGMENDEDEINDGIPTYKVILLGNAGVGKTQIVNVAKKGSFDEQYKATILNSPSVFIGNNDGKSIKLAIWDTPGQKKFNSCVDVMCNEAHAVVLVYDITNEQSFENIPTLIQLAQKHANKDAAYFLVGNKADMEKEGKRNVRTEDTEKYAEENKMQFCEVSAKDGTKIKELFEAIVKKLVKKVPQKLEDKKKDIQIPTSRKNKCCDCCPCCNKDEDDKKEEIKSPETTLEGLMNNIN